MPRQRRREYRAPRPDEQTRWSGFNYLAFDQGTTQQETVLWDPSVELVEAMARPMLKAIRGQLTVRGRGSASDQDTFGAYIMAWDTDATQTVPTLMPWSPVVQDAQVAEKSVLWMMVGEVPDTQVAPWTVDIHIKSRRDLDPAKAIILVTDYTDNVNQCRVTGQLRTLTYGY